MKNVTFLPTAMTLKKLNPFIEEFSSKILYGGGFLYIWVRGYALRIDGRECQLTEDPAGTLTSLADVPMMKVVRIEEDPTIGIGEIWKRRIIGLGTPYMDEPASIHL